MILQCARHRLLQSSRVQQRNSPGLQFAVGWSRLDSSGLHAIQRSNPARRGAGNLRAVFEYEQKKFRLRPFRVGLHRCRDARDEIIFGL